MEHVVANELVPMVFQQEGKNARPTKEDQGAGVIHAKTGSKAKAHEMAIDVF